MNPKTFAILIALLILVLIFDLIRRQKMTFKYSLMWLSGALLVLTMVVFDDILRGISNFAGFTLLSNFIFFLSLVFFMVVSLFLTVYINEQNSRTEHLAQAVGILENKIEKMQSNKHPD